MKAKHLYVHQVTGEMVQATRSEAKKLPNDYKKVEFSTNEKGLPTARVHMDGGVTMQITENEQQTVGSSENVNTIAE